MRCSRLITFLAVWALAGCAAMRVVPVRILPPPELSQACEEPAGGPQTNGELAQYALALRDALRGCNRRLEALREWADKEPQ